MAPDKQKVWTDVHTDDAKTISLRLRRGIIMNVWRVIMNVWTQHRQDSPLFFNGSYLYSFISFIMLCDCLSLDQYNKYEK